MKWKLAILSVLFMASLHAMTEPNAPIDGGAYNFTEDSVRLNFKDMSDNEEGFKVYHNDVVLGTADAKNGSGAIQYINLTELAPSTLYTVKIVAFNSFGESSALVKSFRTTEASPTSQANSPARPGSYVGVWDETETTAQISFKDNSDNEQGFRVEDLDGNVLLNIPAKASSGEYQYAQLIGLTPGTLYYIKVFAYNASGDSAPSGTKTFRTKIASNSNDTVAPTITLLGNVEENVTKGSTYIDAGATALDDVDGDISSDINVTSTVNTDLVGIYSVKYNVKDNAGNVADEVIRTVTVIENGVIESGSLRGRIVDISGNAIENAIIQIGNQERLSNNNGDFTFNELNVSNRVLISVEKTNYFNNSKIIQIQKDLETITSIVLAQERGRLFSSTEEIIIQANGGGELSLPANNYIDQDGNPYNGDVELSLNYYPISTQQGRDMFPGNFDAVNSFDEEGTLRSYGFMIMSLQDTLGNPLDINEKAEITIPADLSLGTPPETIPLWYYDEEIGIWIEDGVAIYDEDIESYQGEITQIAVYNLDIFMNSGNLKVCVEDDNGNKLNSAYVQIESPSTNWFGQVGPTNSTGYINILNVMGATNLNLSAYLLDGRYGIYSNNPVIVTPGIDNELASCIVVSEGNSTLTGVVQELETGVKLGGVKVIVRTGGIYLRELFTDDNGVYTITGLNGGLMYSLEYSKDRYVSNSYSNISLGENQIKTLEVINLSQNSAILDGEISGTLTDVLTGNGVDDVQLNVRRGINNQNGIILEELQTLVDGTYSTTLRAGVYTLEAIKDGYITSYFTVTVIGGTLNTNQNGSISPVTTEGDMRIVLTWGASPSDLDSHVVRKSDGTQDYHVYYGNKRSNDASLDHDDVSSYGPETITITNPLQNSIYTYYVYNFSGGVTGLKNSTAKVTVAFNNRQRVFNVPNENGLYWKVFEIENGAILPCSINCVQNTITTRGGSSFSKLSEELSAPTLSNHMTKEEEVILFSDLPSK